MPSSAKSFIIISLLTGFVHSPCGHSLRPSKLKATILHSLPFEIGKVVITAPSCIIMRASPAISFPRQSLLSTSIAFSIGTIARYTYLPQYFAWTSSGHFCPRTKGRVTPFTPSHPIMQLDLMIAPLSKEIITPSFCWSMLSTR